jgi:hypothetical protein
MLGDSPKTGANLSSRVVYETKEKYFLIDNYKYVMIYEIISDRIFRCGKLKKQIN